MDIFDLVATLSLDSSKYEEGLQGAESSASSVGSAITSGLGKVGAGVSAGIGVAVAGVTALSGALVSGVNDLASYGDEVDKESQKLHMSAQGYQEWSAILEHSGSSISGLKMGMKTLTNELSKGMDVVNETAEQEQKLNEQLDNGEISLEQYNEAYDALYEGAYKSIDTFEALGFSLNDVALMAENPEEAFNQIITALQSVEDETQRTALANDLLGRSAIDLAPLLNTSAEETEEMRQRVHELGGVLSDEAVKASASFQDQLQDMQTATEGLKRNLLSDFLPSITEVMGGLTDIFAGDSSEGIEKISSGIDSIVAKISDKLPEFLNVGANIVLSIADSIVANAPKIIKAGIGVLKDLAIKLVDALPDLISTATEIITTVIDSLSETLPELIPKVTEAVVLLIEKLLDNLPLILKSLLNLITTVVDSLLTEGLPIIIGALPDIIMGIVNFILTAIPDILNAVIMIVQAIAENLPLIIQQIVDILPDLIDSIISAILDNLPIFIDAGIRLFLALIEAMPQIIMAIVGAIPQIIEAIIKAIVKAFPKIVETGKQILGQLLVGLTNIGSSIANSVRKIWDNIKENFKKIINNAKTWGMDLLTSFIDGIKSKISAVTDAVKGVADKVKDFLGFSEPKLGPLSNFHTFAPDMMELFAKGIEDNEKLITDQIADSFDFGNEITSMTNPENNATMNTKNMDSVVSLLQQLVDKETVQISGDAEGMFKIIRKKSNEYYKANNRSAFA